jgi:hypothetical protein
MTRAPMNWRSFAADAAEMERQLAAGSNRRSLSAHQAEDARQLAAAPVAVGDGR